MDQPKNNWENNEAKNKRRGLIASLLIHIGLLFLFLYLSLLAPFPPPGEEGILINLGSMETGSGDKQPAQPEKPANPENLNNKNTQEEMVTQDVEDAPTLEQSEKDVTKKNIEEVEKEPTVNPDAILTPDKIKKDSKGEGDDKIPGDKGEKEGDPAGKTYDGTSYGKGDKGIGFDLEGRQWFRKPNISDVSQEIGRVVIKIKVDRSGNVVSAEFQQKGSTTANAHLINKAKRAAKEARFSANPNAPVFQTGTIIFNFKYN